MTATETTEIFTLSLHDALPILSRWTNGNVGLATSPVRRCLASPLLPSLMISTSGSGPATAVPLPLERSSRSEEHTSELQSHHELVCRLLLEKKKTETRKNSAPP